MELELSTHLVISERGLLLSTTYWEEEVSIIIVTGIKKFEGVLMLS